MMILKHQNARSDVTAGNWPHVDVALLLKMTRIMSS